MTDRPERAANVSAVFASYATKPDYRFVRYVRGFLEGLHRLPGSKELNLPPLRLIVDGVDFVSHAARTGAAITPESDDERIAQEIIEHLKDCRYLLLFCSRETLSSQWVGFEVEWFLAHSELGEDGVLLLVTEGDDPAGEPAAVFRQEIIDRGIHRRLWFDGRAYRAGRNRENAPYRDLEEGLVRLASYLYNDPKIRGTSAAAKPNAPPAEGVDGVTEQARLITERDLGYLVHRNRRRSQRRRMLGIAAFAGVAMVAAAVSLWFEKQAEEQRDIAQERLAVSLYEEGQRYGRGVWAQLLTSEAVANAPTDFRRSPFMCARAIDLAAKQPWTIAKLPFEPVKIAHHPSQPKLASINADETLGLVQLTTEGAEVLLKTEPGERYFDAAFSPSGRLLAAATWLDADQCDSAARPQQSLPPTIDHYCLGMRVWDSDTGCQRNQGAFWVQGTSPYPSWPPDIAFVGGDRFVFMSGRTAEGGSLSLKWFLFELEKPGVVVAKRAAPQSIGTDHWEFDDSYAFSPNPDSTLVYAVADHDRQRPLDARAVQALDVRTGKPATGFKPIVHADDIDWIRLSGDGKRLATASAQEIRITDLTDSSTVATHKLNRNEPHLARSGCERSHGRYVLEVQDADKDLARLLLSEPYWTYTGFYTGLKSGSPEAAAKLGICPEVGDTAAIWDVTRDHLKPIPPSLAFGTLAFVNDSNLIFARSHCEDQERRCAERVSVFELPSEDAPPYSPTRNWDIPRPKHESFADTASTIVDSYLLEDGRTTLTVYSDGAVRIHTHHQHPAADPLNLQVKPSRARFTPDGRYLIAASVTETSASGSGPKYVTNLELRLFDTRTGRPIGPTRTQEAGPFGRIILAPSADSARFAAVTSVAREERDDPKAGPPGEMIAQVIGTADGALVSSATRLRREKPWMPDGRAGVAFADGSTRLLIVGSIDGISSSSQSPQAVIWNLDNGIVERLNWAFAANLRFASIDISGRALLMTSNQKSVSYRLQSGGDMILFRLEEPQSGVSAIPLRSPFGAGSSALSAGNERLAVYAGQRLTVWSLDGTRIGSGTASVGANLRFSQDGALIAGFDTDTVQVYETDRARPVTLKEPVLVPILDVAFARDSKTLRVVNKEGRLRKRPVWSPQGECPAWVGDLGEALTGYRLGTDGAVESIPNAEFEELREALTDQIRVSADTDLGETSSLFNAMQSLPKLLQLRPVQPL